MNWEAISTVLQILGTFAVFASVIYLAIQVKQNSKIAKSAVRHSVTETIMAPPNNFIQSETFCKAFISKLNKESLTPEQSLQLQVYCYMTLKSWENMSYQFRSKMILEEEWTPLRNNLKLIMKIPQYQEYWEREREIYQSTFCDLIDTILLEINEDSELPDAVKYLKEESN